MISVSSRKKLHQIPARTVTFCFTSYNLRVGTLNEQQLCVAYEVIKALVFPYQRNVGFTFTDLLFRSRANYVELCCRYVGNRVIELFISIWFTHSQLPQEYNEDKYFCGWDPRSGNTSHNDMQMTLASSLDFKREMF